MHNPGADPALAFPNKDCSDTRDAMESRLFPILGCSVHWCCDGRQGGKKLTITKTTPRGSTAGGGSQTSTLLTSSHPTLFSYGLINNLCM